MKILFVSHSHAGGAFVVGSHHLAREFARGGHEVLHLSSPYSRLHQLLRRGAAGRAEAARLGLHQIDGAAHLVPLSLAPGSLTGRATIKHALHRIQWDRADVLLIDQPRLAARRLHDFADVVIYRPTDIYTDRLSRRGQALAIAQADAVVATSYEVAQSIDVDANLPVHVIPNGVHTAHFLSEGDNDGRRGVVYVGALDSRFDWNTVCALASAYPSEAFVLAGPVQCEFPTDLPKNINAVGPVDYSRIPKLLSGARVGLLPFSDNPVNAGRSPMKLYEYLASGLYVVAKRTGPLTSASPPGMFLYGDRPTAVASLRQALEARAPNLGGVEESMRHDWAVNASSLIDIVCSIPSRP